ncbi:MAG: ABC transporter permease [Bacteroides sp.]
MKQLIRQAAVLIRQNPLFSVVSIVGTALTIAFVTVVVMIYDFRTSDIAPENCRSRLLYADAGQTSRPDGTNVNTGMGRVAYEALFSGLPGVEEHTWYAAMGKSVCSLPASSERFSLLVRPVAANWFDFFQYEFIAGRPFTQEEYDMGRSAYTESRSEFHEKEAVNNPAYRMVVLTERVAGCLFGSAEAAVGQVFWVDFHPSTVVGVVRDVSSIFQTAYADAFQPFSLCLEENVQYWTAGLGGIRRAVLRMAPDASVAAIRQEVERRQQQLNQSGLEYRFTLNRLYTHTEYTFFRGSAIDARLVYLLLVVALLVVPAISISGLMSAQMQGRLSEIAIRKAYGASNLSILSRLFSEGLLTTLLGGVAGYFLSCLLVWWGRVWLFGSGGTELEGITLDGHLLMRPSLCLAVLLACLLFNLLSMLLPACLAIRRSISGTLMGE